MQSPGPLRLPSDTCSAVRQFNVVAVLRSGSAFALIDVEQLRPKPSDESVMKHLELGHSAHGFVYRAEWSKGKSGPAQPVAVKRYQLGGEDAPAAAISQLRQEAETTVALNHPNVVTVIGAVLDPRAPCLVMEIEPASLDYILSVAFQTAPNGDSDLFSWPLRLHVLAGTAAGLLALHSAKPAITHGGIKPANVLVDATCNARVTDFGVPLLKALAEDRERKAQGKSVPTEDSAAADLSAMRLEVDVVGFGMLMWEVMTGQQPYPDQPRGVAIGRLLKGDCPPLPSPLPQGCPASYGKLLLSCWIKPPGKRVDLKALHAELKGFTLTHGEAMELQVHDLLTVLLSKATHSVAI